MPHDKDQTHWHEPSGSKKAGFGEFKKQPTPYDAFMESEGVPVFRGIGIRRVQDLPLAPWKRTGGRGHFIQPHLAAVPVSWKKLPRPPGSAPAAAAISSSSPAPKPSGAVTSSRSPPQAR